MAKSSLWFKSFLCPISLNSTSDTLAKNSTLKRQMLFIKKDVTVEDTNVLSNCSHAKKRLNDLRFLSFNAISS
jgi:hypothetical protein